MKPQSIFPLPRPEKGTQRYKTFIRTCATWREFASARKRTVDRGLTFDEALRACDRYNAELSEADRERGKRMEFERET